LKGASGGRGGGAIGYSDGFYFAYGFGGNAEIIISRLLLGAGYGWTGATLEAAGNNLSTFVRGPLGFQTGGYGNKAETFKFHYDYNFDGGYRIGLLVSFYAPLLSGSILRPAPRPAPQPQPAPPPPPPPAPPSGVIYYDYNGTGYVYLSDAVFYHCSDGNPLGYGEGGAIYAFNGRCLGFLEDNFIYDLKGLPKGAVDPISLGLDAQAKKPVTQEAKQSLPAKQSPVPVTKPKLSNTYRGGLLSDVFK
jgi:hypothetical protein